MFGHVLCCLLTIFVNVQVETLRLTIPPDFRPPPLCGPVCRIACPYGNVKDGRRCPVCECNPGPILCPKRICPTIRCAYGLAKDRHGCDICRCKTGPLPPVMRKCPANSKSNIQCFPDLTRNSCTSNADCLGGKICCLYGCSKKCIRPKVHLFKLH